jgi:hypothetical protein
MKVKEQALVLYERALKEGKEVIRTLHESVTLAADGEKDPVKVTLTAEEMKDEP